MKQDKYEHDNLQEIEYTIWESHIEKVNKEKESVSRELQFRKQIQAQIYTCISSKTGVAVNKENYFEVLATLTDEMWDQVLYEVFGTECPVINPRNFEKQFSLIGDARELQECIPSSGPMSELEALTEKANSRKFEVMHLENPENTYRAYTGDIVYWEGWLNCIGFTFEQPLTVQDIITFIIQHAENVERSLDQKLVEAGLKSKLGPHKISTIKRRVASLSVRLEQKDLPNPCRDFEIKKLFQKLTKKWGSSKPAGKAITKDILDAMIETCGDKLIDKRDKALLLFTWSSGGRRRSEVVAAQIKDLLHESDGDFIYNIPHSKTDQESKGHPVPIKGRAAQALKEWLTFAQITEGAIFRSISKGGEVGNALSDIDVYRIVKRRARLAGYDEDNYSAHSLRSGFVTEAGKRNKPLGDIMALTTHRNVSTVMKYYQAGNIKNNSASNLAD